MRREEMGMNSKGFSLIELIIVMAIMAILVGVIAASYIGYIEKARAAKCMAKREAVREIMVAEVSEGSTATAEEMLEHALEQTHEKCPSGGTYSAKFDENGEIIVNCSKHTDKTKTMGDDGVVDAIVEIMRHYGAYVDSGADSVSDSCNTALAKEEMKKAGLDMDSMGVKSWQFSAGTKQKDNRFYFSTVDISKLPNGAKVPVICYNPTSGNYTVWTATVSDKGQTATGGDANYNVYHTFTNFQPSTSTTANGNQTYAGAKKHYDDLEKQTTGK